MHMLQVSAAFIMFRGTSFKNLFEWCIGHKMQVFV